MRLTPLSGVFGVENAGHSWEALQQAVDRVVAIIQSDPNKDRTDRIITRWLKRHLQRLGAEVHLDQLNSLVEDRDMLAENLENLENLVKKERLEGMLAGRQEGRQEGEHMKAEQIHKIQGQASPPFSAFFTSNAWRTGTHIGQKPVFLFASCPCS